MIYPNLQNRGGWTFASAMRWPRSGPGLWALSRQLGALDRRRRLGAQQQELRSGATNYGSQPPYPDRPRPPS